MKKIALILLTCAAAIAQDTITPEKRALLNELVKVSDLAAVIQKSMAAMANRVGANFNEVRAP